MFDTFDRTGNAEFPFPKAVVFRSLREAITKLKGMTIENADAMASRIDVKTGMSAFSWGENISISVVSSGPEASVVSIGSGAKTIFGSATAHGKNKQNVALILRAASTILASDGVKWRDEMTTRSAPTGTPTAASVADELAKLAALRDQGILSTEEFESQKRRVLGH